MSGLPAKGGARAAGAFTAESAMWPDAGLCARSGVSNVRMACARLEGTSDQRQCVPVKLALGAVVHTDLASFLSRI